jgi:hypothetical protein
MEQTRLARMILNHWQTHCPLMVAQLSQRNLRFPALLQAQSQTVDILHELITRNGMNFLAAWELAIQEALLPTEARPESSTLSQSLH